MASTIDDPPQYDNNGNLTSKNDARNITTTLGYDSLNRLTSKSYNDTPQTPPVYFYYDAQSLLTGAPTFTRGYSIGRLVAVTYGSGSSAGTYLGYDALGRVVRHIQQTDSVNYLSEATYNVSGAMKTQTYPSVPGASDRRTVSYNYDGAARLSSLASAATTYAAAASVSSISYKPHGGLESETLGNSLIHQMVYNTRLQPTSIKLGTSGAPTSVLNLTYDYGTTNNNGNVLGTVNTIGFLTLSQSYTYDSLNRIATATETSSSTGSSWSQRNGYDRYGNRWIDLGGGVQSLSFNTANNRITGKTYDPAGNLTQDGATTYGYDAENHMVKVNSVESYRYDGEGKRVRKLSGENTRFVYGMRWSSNSGHKTLAT
jgi:YD repeat-containing protein